MNEGACNVPSGICVQFVLLRSALLAIVFIRNLTLFNNAHTSTMLPDTATVTRDEQSASVLVLSVGRAESLALRWARIFLLAANASRHLFFVASVFIDIVGVLDSFFLFELVGALTSSWRLACLLAGPRVRSSGLCDIVRFCNPILTTG